MNNTNNQNITRKIKKKSWLGYGTEKLKLTDVIERLVDLPDESIVVYDIDSKEYKKMKKEEEKKKKLLEGRRNLNENQRQNLGIRRGPRPRPIINPDGSVTTQNPDGSVTTQTLPGSTDQNQTETVPEDYSFDSSIDINDQEIIKTLITEFNIILRLPELNLFSNKAIKEEGEPGAVTIIETTINEADGSQKQAIEKILIPPFITVDEI